MINFKMKFLHGNAIEIILFVLYHLTMIIFHYSYMYQFLVPRLITVHAYSLDIYLCGGLKDGM